MMNFAHCSHFVYEILSISNSVIEYLDSNENITGEHSLEHCSMSSFSQTLTKPICDSLNVSVSESGRLHCLVILQEFLYTSLVFSFHLIMVMHMKQSLGQKQHKKETTYSPCGCIFC
ncbi:hypothetical protein V8G54_037376 [Vigna mungo]|uniref:Uncharacterized protein n=1 Tax=Vigna mungo TaxID=3915 RepID=A0AAQ3MIS8_VIGMU